MRCLESIDRVGNLLYFFFIIKVGDRVKVFNFRREYVEFRFIIYAQHGVPLKVSFNSAPRTCHTRVTCPDKSIMQRFFLFFVYLQFTEYNRWPNVNPTWANNWWAYLRTRTNNLFVLVSTSTVTFSSRFNSHET